MTGTTIYQDDFSGAAGVATPRLAQRVVWKGDYKLIHDRKIKSVQLFNLADDPLETKDLVNDPASALVLKELLALRDEYDAEREYCPMAQADMEKFKKPRKGK